MNIVRALNVALPELPSQIVRRNPPKLDPRVIAKEHVEKGEAVVLTKMPGTDLVFRFSPLQWKLIQFFDGIRSHGEIAEQFRKENSYAVTEEDVQELASFLQRESQLLYKSPIEQNIALHEQLRAARGKRSRFRGLDFSDITIKTWDDADRYISWLYPKVRFLFTPWFVWTSVVMFLLMGWMWASRFGDIWSDSFAFFNFTRKSGAELVEFWFLFGAMAAVHETAHGLVGKHFGATVEKMGFTLMYFAPSFFCDSTQVWVLGGRWARIATAIAGIWLDLVLCFFATVVWWATATGMPIHDFSYKVMMVTGLGVSILNLNPLIKLDGYLIFSEFVAEPSLKESSTLYLSAWMRRNIFRLPVEVPYVPRRKRVFFVSYAILSGLYSYSLLSFLMIITYDILRSFTPEWAFLPAFVMGVWVFNSRIKLAVAFMKTIYLDKKERLLAALQPKRILAMSVAAVILFFLPLWPDLLKGPFLIEAGEAALLRAPVAGRVDSVSVREGQSVEAGMELIRLRNSRLDSEAAIAHAEVLQATARANQAAQTYQDLAQAELKRRQRVQELSVANDHAAQLLVRSPISGTVVTPHLTDLIGKSVDAGDFLVQVNDSSRVKVDIYIPEFDMHDVAIGQEVRLLVPGRLLPISGVLSTVSPIATNGDAITTKEQLAGINPPRYYRGTVTLRNENGLSPGATGIGKILVARRSLAGFAAAFVRDLVQRRIW